MKKSLINIAITMAFSSALFSGVVLSTQVYADDMVADNNTSNEAATETYMYTAMGTGAASGALVAGPVGMLVGGLIGAIAGSSQQVSTIDESIISAQPENNVLSVPGKQPVHLAGTQIAQLGKINTVVEPRITSQQEKLLNILTADLSLDIYFRSGSSNIETFYPARLAAIAELMNTMNELEIHLDGYTDRRGDKIKNIALAKQRIEKVRKQLINAGVDENRIISKAFGEMKMVSTAGDLEAYTFDRKVVIRFQRSTANSISSMNTALSEFNTEAENTDAVVADTRIEF